MFCTITDFDLQILYWIRDHLACPALDFLMPLITMLGDAGIFWIAVSLALMLTKKYRKAGFSMGLALLIGVIIGNGILKNVIARVRPYDLDTALTPLIAKLPTDFSFPSGHTLASFEASVALAIRDKKLGIPAIVLAVLIAFSRLYLLVHYPSDILGGFILGTGFAMIASLIINLIYRKFEAHQAKKTPPEA